MHAMSENSSKSQAVRGTQDLRGSMASAFRHIDSIASQLSELYRFEELKTPIFEHSEVFHRTLGETSDVVSKETYTFLDRGGDSLTLRPEGTAGAVRAFISNGWTQDLPCRFFYSGPMFRYERPQKGRYRQFHQIGVEALGLNDPSADVESLSLAHDLLLKLGLKNRFKLHINTLGDLESRQNYRKTLVDYFTQHKAKLSQDSLVRLEKNPLRILDSKDPGDREIIKNAPQFSSSLTPQASEFFQQVLSGLKSLEIEYHLDPLLVRGLDYYSHTVFEFITTDLGAQGALLAGGRYDGLVKLMGGGDVSGVGWAAGVERLALMIESQFASQQKPLVAVLAAEDSAINYCQKISHLVRSFGNPVELITSGNMGKKFKRADKIKSQFCVVIGSKEMSSKILTLKNMATGVQIEVGVEGLKKTLES